MDVTATEYYCTVHGFHRPWTSPLQNIIQHMNFTADGRYCFRTSQPIGSTVDERYRYKISLRQILKILASHRLSQLDANAERLHFFSMLPLFRAVTIVAVASTSNNIRLHGN